jgi:hypothetical protein
MGAGWRISGFWWPDGTAAERLGRVWRRLNRLQKQWRRRWLTPVGDTTCWAPFCQRYGVALRQFLAPVSGQMRPEIFLAPEDARTGAVKVLRVQPYARFGNNFYQLLNAVMLARAMQCNVVEISGPGDGGVVAPAVIDGMSIRFHADAIPQESTLCGHFFIPDGMASLLRGYDTAFLADSITRYVRPVYARYIAACDVPAARVLTMHFRGGDIFYPNVQAFGYVQPPASFYLLALDYAVRRLAVHSVQLVFEDRSNPAVDVVIAALQARGMAFSVQSAALFEDVAALLGARHLVAAYGTFCEAAALLSPTIETYFAFRGASSQRHIKFWAQSRVADVLRFRGVRVCIISDLRGYITAGSWRNTARQRELIRSYPMASLRLVE